MSIRLIDLENVVTDDAKVLITVTGDKPCTIKCAFGNIPNPFKCARINCLSAKNLRDEDSCFGSTDLYLTIEITDL